MSSTGGSRVELFLSASGIKSKDFVGKSDPYAVVYHRAFKLNSNATASTNDEESWTEIGKTEVIDNNHEPEWLTSIETAYKFEEEQQLLVKIFDQDSMKSDNFLGQARFSLSTVMGAKDNIKSFKLVKPGKDDLERGSVTVLGLQKGGRKRVMKLKMRGVKIASKDWGGLRASDPFYEICVKAGESYKVVHRSEVKEKSKNPEWAAIQLDLSTVAGNSLDSQFRIAVYDHDDHSDPDLIGQFDLTANDAVAGARSEKPFDLVHPPTKSKYQKASYKHSGQIVFEVAQVEYKPTFLEYISGGCEINFTVAIDYTSSNGDPHDERSLHFIDDNSDNQYEAAIKQVCSILEPYDSDKQIPVYGYGGVIDGEVSHCFHVSLNENAKVDGTAGVLQAYRNSIKSVQLCYPTFFSQVIRQATHEAYNPEVSSVNQKYTILLIITDGAITDMQETVDAIVEASKYAMSIVIVGVGSADFGSMERLDSDDEPLVDSKGNVCTRDIVQFVEFKSTVQNNNLAAATLAEIPNQVVQYFTKLNVQPNPEPKRVLKAHEPKPMSVAAPTAM